MAFATIEFTGGVNNRIHPTLLDKNVCVELENGITDNGKIRPIRGLHPIEQTAEELGHYGSNFRSVVKWYNRHYWSNNYARSEFEECYGGYPENYIGIPYPVYTSDEQGYLVQLEDVAAAAEEETLFAHGANYKYCVTFVNENGWESAPGSLTEYWLLHTVGGDDTYGAKQIDLQFVMANIPRDRVSKVRVWRTIAEGADFFCVGEIDLAGISSDFYTFEDTMADNLAEMAESLSSEDNYPPPSGGKYLTEYGGVFFLAVGTTLYFSSQGSPHAWPTLNFIEIGDTITGICTEFEGVLVFTRNQAYRIVGADSPETVTKINLPGNQGCRTWHSIAHLNNMPMWVSNDGLCSWDGESVTIISDRRFELGSSDIYCALSGNEVYYLFCNDGKAICYDLRNGGIFRTVNPGVFIGYGWYDADADVIYLQNNYDSNQVYRFNDGEELQIRYVSPWLVNATTLTQKLYREVIVTVTTDAMNLKFTCEDTRQILSLSLKKGRNRIKLPFTAVGRYADLEISGIGGIDELAVAFD